MVTDANSETSNVVLYDILENASDENGNTGWKGALKGIDTSKLRYLGVQPRIYYSIEANLSYNNEDNLSVDKNPSIWTETPPADLSTVTALAFDLRKTPDGKDFIFMGRKVAEVELTMKAPKEKQKGIDYAYNRPAYLSTTKTRGMANSKTSFNISNPVKIELEKSIPPTPLDPPKTDIKVEKIWQGKDGEKIEAPVDKIEVELYRDGEKTDKKLELNKDNNWTGEFKDLDVVEKLDSKEAYKYTVKEVGEDKGSLKLEDKKFSVSYEGSMEDGFKITNKLEETSSPWTPITPPKEDIKVEKVWQDKDGKEITAPEKEIEVELYRDGTATDKKLKLNAENNWSGEFKDLDVVEKLDSKEAYKYSVKEVGEETGRITIGNNKYQVMYKENAENEFTVINKKEKPDKPWTPIEEKTIDIEVKKYWNLNRTRKPIEKIEVELYRDEKATGKIIKLNEDNNWSGVFKNLDQRSSVKNRYYYSVKEIGESGNTIKLDGKWFDVYYRGNMDDGFTITNEEERPYRPGRREEPKPENPSEHEEPKSSEKFEEEKISSITENTEKKQNTFEDIVKDEDTEEKENKAYEEDSNTEDLPKTGDGINPSTYAWVLLILGGLMTIVGLKRKKNDK